MFFLEKKLFDLPVVYLYFAIISYIYIGIYLFLFGWCAWYVSLPCAVILFFVVCKMLKDYNTNDTIPFRLSAIVGIILMGVIVYTFGWGRFVSQTGDWAKHNAIINDLVNYRWPVVYEGRDGANVLLTYYLGQYLFPCLIGKFFSSYRVAEIANALWAYWGCILVYVFLLRVARSKTSLNDFLVLFLLFFFCLPTSSGRTILSWMIDGNEAEEEWVFYKEDIKLQYSSNWVLLAWVHPQAIVCWMALLLFIEKYKMIEHYVPLLLPLLLYGSFSFIGVLPYALVWVLYRFIIDKNRKEVLLNVFSVSNLLTTLSLGVVLISYFLGNVMGEKPSNMTFHMVDYSNYYIVYVVFVCTQILPYMILIFDENRRNWIYYLTLATLMLWPLFSMGLYNDLTMRCSIPSLFVLMLMVLFKLRDFKTSYIRSLLLAIILIFSSSNSVLRVLHVLYEDNYLELAHYESYETMGIFINKDDPSIGNEALKYNYYTYNLEESIFYRFIALKP